MLDSRCDWTAGGGRGKLAMTEPYEPGRAIHDGGEQPGWTLYRHSLTTSGRLDKALADSLTDLSRVRIRALIEAGHAALDGATVTDAAMRVKAGQHATLRVPPPEPARPQAQAIDLSVVFEDDEVIVIDKPAGLVVHPAAGNADGTLVNALLAHCGASLSGVGGAARPGIVHRLDKDTSGLMVVAKTDRAHQALSAQFADRSLSRVYIAVVHGLPNPVSGVVDAPIGRHPRDRIRMAVVRGAAGRPARTHYRLIAPLTGDEGRARAASVIACKLETGRTHQIRVHMAHVGHALVGDPLYAGGRAVRRVRAIDQRLARQALHAAHLRFVHPTARTPLTFTTPLPDDMMMLIDALGGRAAAASAEAASLTWTGTA